MNALVRIVGKMYRHFAPVSVHIIPELVCSVTVLVIMLQFCVVTELLNRAIALLNWLVGGGGLWRHLSQKLIGDWRHSVVLLQVPPPFPSQFVCVGGGCHDCFRQADNSLLNYSEFKISVKWGGVSPRIYGPVIANVVSGKIREKVRPGLGKIIDYFFEVLVATLNLYCKLCKQSVT